MPFRSPILIITALLFSLACGRSGDSDHGNHSDPDQPDAQEKVSKKKPENHGAYQGYYLTNDIIKERIINDDTFDIAQYIADDGDESMALLLGGASGNGLENGIKNAQPNAVNTLLWYFVAAGVAYEAALFCEDESNEVEFHAEFTNALLPICNSDPDKISNDDLNDLWTKVMRYDAPEAEQNAWRDFVRSDIQASRIQTRSSIIQEMVIAMLYNPHFLILK